MLGDAGNIRGRDHAVTKTILIAAGIGIAAFAGVAVAQPGEDDRAGGDTTRQDVIQRTEARFDRLDENRDGRLTPDEARAAGQRARAERADRAFDRLDANDDGSISRDEMRDGHGRRMRAAGGGGLDGPGRRMRGMRGFGEQGFITRDQMRDRALARFDRLDADRNGTVTMAERQAAREARRERRRQRMQDDS